MQPAPLTTEHLREIGSAVHRTILGTVELLAIREHAQELLLEVARLQAEVDRLQVEREQDQSGFALEAQEFRQHITVLEAQLNGAKMECGANVRQLLAAIAETDRLRVKLAFTEDALHTAEQECDEGRRRCEGLAERVAGQSELLTRRAEKPT